jgi:hypothetical protein
VNDLPVVIIEEPYPMGPVHIRHSTDGYPLCWPQDADGEFRGTYEAALSTCEPCKKISAEIDVEIKAEMEAS